MTRAVAVTAAAVGLASAGCGSGAQLYFDTCAVNVVLKPWTSALQAQLIRAIFVGDRRVVKIRLLGPRELRSLLELPETRKLPTILQVVPRRPAGGPHLARLLRPRPSGVIDVSFLRDGCTLPRPPDDISKSERRALEADVRAQLAASRRRKAAAVARNRKVLDSLPLFPGARFLHESQNPEGHRFDLGKQTRHESELELVANQLLEGDAYLDWGATDWGTFRAYSLPRGASERDVYRFLRTHLDRSWTAHPSSSPPSFSMGATCVWLLFSRIGRPTVEVATDRRDKSEAC